MVLYLRDIIIESKNKFRGIYVKSHTEKIKTPYCVTWTEYLNTICDWKATEYYSSKYNHYQPSIIPTDRQIVWIQDENNNNHTKQITRILNKKSLFQPIKEKLKRRIEKDETINDIDWIAIESSFNEKLKISYFKTR